MSSQNNAAEQRNNLWKKWQNPGEIMVHTDYVIVAMLGNMLSYLLWKCWNVTCGSTTWVLVNVTVGGFWLKVSEKPKINAWI